MGIAEAVFLQVQNLPEDKAKEVLDFARFLAERSQQENTITVMGKRQPNLLKGQVKIIDQEWHKPSADIEDDFYK
ncbi:DUF2281 domain-containing protein [Acinetobacter sp. NIPH 2699]|uniref:DUF2281 domain-containing protein n=1 Tax=Acinetobacter sp. NIPH 2699 TaxID=2923433 RepID=UPI001F4A938C|nr:DUF2281 domain-containing protein [Acinetobacter sp. NIPH 2699]MCH7336726.1 DUF2281 domain-containing protein [Acinetobacter sp. NIPH 2699]